jgi:chromosomal replication initiation ATPase DnaA
VPTLRDIKRETCKAFGVTAAELSGPSRERRIAHARAIFVAVSRKMLKASQERIGREINRHHSTVLHLERRGMQLVRDNPEYKQKVLGAREALRETL